MASGYCVPMAGGLHCGYPAMTTPPTVDRKKRLFRQSTADGGRERRGLS